MNAPTSKLRKVRKEKKLTQVQLSILTRISQTRLSHLETGKRFPNPLEIRSLMLVLKKKESDLFGKDAVALGAENQVRKRDLAGISASSPRFRLIP